MERSIRLTIVMFTVCALLSSGVAWAATTSSIVGTVRGQNGAPIAGADVALEGVVRLSQKTDNTGAFAFRDITTGAYTIVVTKPGFQSYRSEGVSALSGETVTVSVLLAEATFSAQKTIPNVSTSRPGVAPLNTSTAAINTISGDTFLDQGSQQVTTVLNQTPGIFTTPY